MKGLRWLHLQPSQGVVGDNIHADTAIRGSGAWKTGKNKSPQQMLNVPMMDRLASPIFKQGADEAYCGRKAECCDESAGSRKMLLKWKMRRVTFFLIISSQKETRTDCSISSLRLKMGKIYVFFLFILPPVFFFLEMLGW